MYQPFPRKYRPQTFNAVVGQDLVVLTLKNALKFQRVAYAYLFCGSRGTGKTTLARIFAKALNCLQITPDFEPCNQCPSCLEITSGRCLDVLEIDGASNRGIDDIRQINETVGYASCSGKNKIYIIDEVHMLTKEAFNALLKTLEEPPPNVKFLFATTEPHKILPTIISRCQRFDLNRIPARQIVQKLKTIAQNLKVDIQEEALELIAHLSEGGLRDAESLLDQLICYSQEAITYDMIAQKLGLSSRNTYFQLDKAIDESNHPFAFKLTDELFASGKDFVCFFEGLTDHFRTVLLHKLGQPPPSYLNEQDRKNYIENSQLYTEEHTLYILDYLTQWHKEISKTPFKRSFLETILLHLLRSKKRISIATLIRKLHELEKGAIDINNLKNQEFDKEMPQIFCSEQVTLVEWQGASENKLPSVNRFDSIPPIELELKSEAINPTVKQETHCASEAQPDRSASAPIDEDPSREARPRKRINTAKLQQADCLLFDSRVNKTTGNLGLQPEASFATGSEEKTIEETTFHSSRYDTILRFAAVELEGVVKKD